ncbi:MAG: (d)CMP kinase [Alphaproteobacteria bacterium]|nr:(d)CMP kinase [Alphaproteobacteria bacterium]
MARSLAEALNLAYLDTGSLYRAVGVAVLRAGGDPARDADAVRAAESLDLTKFSRDDLRSEAAGGAASTVAAIPGVRAALLEFQRRFAYQPPQNKAGAVLDGRDIGTVICPDADVKIFVTASLEARVERRIKELRAGGQAVIDARVRDDMIARDARDSGRSVAPMVAAADAWVLDTTTLDAGQVLAQAKAFIARKLSR